MEGAILMLSSEIKLIRQKALMTQMEFASQLNVSFSTINRWETGKSIPSLSTLKSLKQFCTVNNIPFENLETEWLKKSNASEEQN